MSTSILATYASDLSAAGIKFYRRGWVLGTSGSARALVTPEPLRVCITASGKDKGDLGETDFLEIDENAAVLYGDGKPSAETFLHSTIYRSKPDVGSVMHTHSVWGTILSDHFFDSGAIEIDGYEMLKGHSGVTTHEHAERVPIIENSQDYECVSREIERVVDEDDGIHGIYLRRHGLYTWGKSIAEAKRHIEIFEFLFEVMGRSLMVGSQSK